MSTAEQSTPLLARLGGVHVHRGGRPILKDISFDLYQGQILTLVGPNGAGKTTLLRALLGLLPVSAGKVWLRPGLRIGFMPQKIQIDPTLPLSVLRFMRLRQKYPQERIAAALARVGAPHVLHAPVQSISGGEMQRMLLARALLAEPDLLVLDEPVQGVDVHGQAELYHLLTQVRDERGCAILLVSHDLHLVMASTDRVVCLNHHLCCTGTPENVVQNDEFIALFGPEIGAQLAVYRHEKAHEHSHGHFCANPDCDGRHLHDPVR